MSSNTIKINSFNSMDDWFSEQTEPQDSQIATDLINKAPSLSSVKPLIKDEVDSPFQTYDGLITQNKSPGPDRESQRIQELDEDFLNSLDKPKSWSSVRSYEKITQLVDRMASMKIIAAKDFWSQVNKCDKWSENHFVSMENAIHSFDYMAGRRDHTFSVLPLINLLNNNNTSSSSKEEKMTPILGKAIFEIQKQEDALIFNLINEADCIKEEMAREHKLNRPVKIKTQKEVDKISRLLHDNIIKVKDLDKYVALGIISSAGLKSWRITDQANNNYYYDDFAEEGSSITEGAPESALDIPGLGFGFQPSKFETEVHKAAVRVAGTQLNVLTRAAIIKSLPADKVDGIKSFLSSELGNSLTSLFGGLILTYSMENNLFAQKLADELRTAGLATLGNEAVGMLTDGLVEIVKNAVAEIPENETVIDEESFIAEDQESLKEINLCK